MSIFEFLNTFDINNNPKDIGCNYRIVSQTPDGKFVTENDYLRCDFDSVSKNGNTYAIVIE